MPSRRSLRKPGFSAAMVYTPVGIVGATYWPPALEVTDRVKPVPVLVSVIAAPATAAPDESLTVPTIAPLSACAHKGRRWSEHRRAMAINPAARENNLSDSNMENPHWRAIETEAE